MAIRRIYTVKYRGIIFEGGHFYTFKYLRWENDPEPLALFMYALRGVHPKTGHYWNLLQMFNLAYVPKKLRKNLVKEYVNMNINIRTYKPKTRLRIGPGYFPSFLDVAYRRYLLKPPGLIQNPREISFEIIDAELAGIAKKDYFTRAQIQKAKRLMHRPYLRPHRQGRRRR